MRYRQQYQQSQRSINKNHLPGTFKKKTIATSSHKLPKFVSPLKNGEGTKKYNKNKNPYVQSNKKIKYK